MEACEILGKSVAAWTERKLRQKKFEEEGKTPTFTARVFM